MTGARVVTAPVGGDLAGLVLAGLVLPLVAPRPVGMTADLVVVARARRALVAEKLRPHRTGDVRNGCFFRAVRLPDGHCPVNDVAPE